MRKNTSRNVYVIGGGIAGLSSACFLSKAGFQVTLIEKNSQLGGRATTLTQNGFVFDKGPSWYWMPDIIEKFFNHFDKTTNDFYNLKRLAPSYQLIFEDKITIAPSANLDELKQQFEELEAGSSKKLEQFLAQAKMKYDLGMNDFVYKPGLSIKEYGHFDLLRKASRLNIIGSHAKHIRQFFSHPVILKMLEFPILFLGGSSDSIPALYSMMNYADMVLGTWYPMGGMHQLIKAQEQIARSLGVNIHTNESVTHITVSNKKATHIHTNRAIYPLDILVGSADYHHIEQELLGSEHRKYDTRYWSKRKMAPSALIFYIGINTTLANLLHHNLFFDADFLKHNQSIYQSKQWPEDPLFYLCCPSKTDDSIAPPNCENLFILIPVACDLQDKQDMEEYYFKKIVQRIQQHTGTDISKHLVYKAIYGPNDFIKDYNSFQGNAYGLANTLKQTAFGKPSIVNKKVQNMFYAGQLTVPGPGIPPTIISGEIIANHITKIYT
ncbi:MAG: phytoene desaturase family protein [Phycisphaerales bacterium]|nr:phytoene desaturase family protein [Phycisphaerales bacterium]